FVAFYPDSGIGQLRTTTLVPSACLKASSTASVLRCGKLLLAGFRVDHDRPKAPRRDGVARHRFLVILKLAVSLNHFATYVYASLALKIATNQGGTNDHTCKKQCQCARPQLQRLSVFPGHGRTLRMNDRSRSCSTASNPTGIVIGSATELSLPKPH